MQPVTKQTAKIYWQHTMRHRNAFGFLVFGIVVVSAIEIYTPFLFKELFNTLAQDRPDTAEVLKNIVWSLFFLTLVHQSLWRAMSYVNNFFQPRVMSDLMNTCYEYLLHHSYGFFNNNFVGSIVNRVRKFSSAFETVADELTWEIARTILKISAVLAVLFTVKPIFGYITLVWCMIYVSFAYVYSQFKLKHDIRKSLQDTKTTAHLSDTLTNNLNLKLFNGYVGEVKAFRAITEKLFNLRRLAWDMGQHAEVFQSLALAVLNLSLMYGAVVYWERGELTIGHFALIQAYLGLIFERLWNLGRNLRKIYEALADANEMTQMLMEPHEVVDAAGAGKLKVPAGEIEFKNVVFHYHEETPILERFNLKISAGEKVGLIGPSGGGKTTIIKLLFRFKDIQEGKILIDGQDISQVTQESLRKTSSLVPQDPILFHRTLLENIRYGKPTATEAEVVEAAKAAHAHEFISQFPEGYKTYVGERGVKLSGGERQRVAIARAILKNAPILVLDEATSSLDSESEALIQDALATLMKDKTTIVVAHRLSTIMKMDRIVVIEDGVITEQGKHEELLKASQGTYQRLWEIQAGGFATVR